MFGQGLSGRGIVSILEEMRPGEPPLGRLCLYELSWLDAALTHLEIIWRHREEGISGNRPFCIFSFESDPGSPYIQFLAHSGADLLLCEAVSVRSAPDIAAVLRPEGENLLRDFGFAAPGVSPNYSQRIDIRDTVDLAYAARLACRVFKQVYKVEDFGRGSFRFNLTRTRPLSLNEPGQVEIDDMLTAARPEAGKSFVIVGATPFKKAAVPKDGPSQQAPANQGSLANFEVILKVAAEGGRLTLHGRRASKGWHYSVTTSEWMMDEVEFDEPSSQKQTKVVDAWEAALRLLDRYPWHRLHPLSVHPEFRDRVWAALQSRVAADRTPLEERQIEHWKQMCR